MILQSTEPIEIRSEHLPMEVMTAILKGEITSFIVIGFNTILVKGDYYIEADDADPVNGKPNTRTNIEKINETISLEKSNTLYDLVIGSLTGEEKWMEMTEILFYNAMISLAANKYKISQDLLEIVAQ